MIKYNKRISLSELGYSMTIEFVHLRVHSEYSLVDGIIRHKKLLGELQNRQMPAIALTDECNMFGVIKQYKSFLSAGVKPIFGVDFKIKVDDEVARLTLLAETNEGYQNLVDLVSRGYLEAARENGIPIIDKSWLTPEILKGLVGLSGAQEGEIGKLIDAGHPNQAKAALNTYVDLFDKNSFFIELQRIGQGGETYYIQNVLKLAVENDVPVVATNDVRFMNLDDYDVHEIRVGISDGYTMLDESRRSRYTDQQYLKSAQEMSTLFIDIPSALQNTVEIAKRCNVTFELGKAVLPQFDIPEGMTEGEFFAKESFDGLEERFPFILTGADAEKKKTLRKEYEERLQIEIDVICGMGFPGYFLIVADFIEWSKNNGVPVGPGRGSGAGSLVAYSLKITDIDPIPYGLLFERFLNPERVSMPDFDIDFCINGRDRVVDYVAQKYGRDSVSQIITYGTLAAKAVVRDVGRVLGQPYGFVDRIAKLIPNELGIKLPDACAKGTPLGDLALEDESVDALLKTALKLEGTVRNVGKHAAGVVISPTLVSDYSPVYCEEGTQQLITQFDKYDVEEAGLVKFDFLGLRNLTIIDGAVKLINRRLALSDEKPVDIAHIRRDDSKTFDLLKRAETTGIFQLESRGMKELIGKLAPDCFEEIIALVALYRPGPLGSGMVDDFVNRKHGRQQVSYPHPKLEEVLKETYGTILYQEQVMQIAQILAGYSLGGADILRRAMGKKDPAEMATQRSIFEEGCAENNINAELATSIFDLMEEFAKYGFNKSHSVAYALVSYQTAWLKTHYPAEFMAALLSSDMDKTDKVINFVRECQRMGVTLLLPHVNHSNYAFSVNKLGAVVYGLGAIKGAGEAAMQMIVDERAKAGEFKDIFNFCKRLDLKKANKRTLEALVYAGALDDMTNHRAQTLATIPAATKAAEQMEKTATSGQNDLFGFDLGGDEGAVEGNQPKVDYAERDTWGLKEKLQKEKAVLGLYLSGHIIDEVKHWLPRIQAQPLSSLEPSHRKTAIRMAGVVTSWEQRKTKRGTMIGILGLDDGTERIEMVLFSKILEAVKDQINVDDTIVVEGEVSIDDFTDRLRITAQSITPFDTALNNLLSSIKLTLNLELMDSHSVENIKVSFGKVNAVDPLSEDSKPRNIFFIVNCGDCQLGLKSDMASIACVNDAYQKISALSFVEEVEYLFD
jgi:DNA polymerase-3 subunit alpha